MSLFFVSCLANHNCLSPHVLFKHGLSDSLTQDFIYGKLALRESIIHAKAPMRNKGPTLSKKWINIPVEVLLFITLHSKFNRTNIWKISIRKRVNVECTNKVNSGNDIFFYIRAVKYLVAFVKEYKGLQLISFFYLKLLLLPHWLLLLVVYFSHMYNYYYCNTSSTITATHYLLREIFYVFFYSMQAKQI